MSTSETGSQIDHLPREHWDPARGRRQQSHRDSQQQHVRKQVFAQVAVEPPLQWSDQLHAAILDAIISSAIVATRPAAPGDPSFSLNAFSAATVSARIVSLKSGSAARTSFSTLTARRLSFWPIL